MKWRAARNIDKNDKIIMLAEAIDSDAGYRIIRQRVCLQGFRYSAWRPAPELSYPSLALLGTFDCSEDAKKACDTHFISGAIDENNLSQR